MTLQQEAKTVSVSTPFSVDPSSSAAVGHVNPLMVDLKVWTLQATRAKIHVGLPCRFLRGDVCV